MFMRHGMTPKDFFAKGEGEQKLLLAFTICEMERKLEREQARDKMWMEFFQRLFGAK